MLDHFSIRVADFARSKEFHLAVLTPLGYKLAMEGVSRVGFSLRPEYHGNYHGAFVLDPDGHNIEAVCHNAS